MRPSIRLVAFAAVSALLAPAAARAGEQVPDPRNSTFYSVVIGRPPAGATSPGGPLEAVNYPVVLKDVNNAPLVGQAVVLHFPASIRLYATQVPGTTVDCAARTLTRVTDATGLASFGPRFGGFDNANLILVWRGSTEQLGTIKARSFDIDGLEGGTGVADFALFSHNYLAAPSAIETDFNQDGTTFIHDFALFAEQYLNAGQGAYCP